MKKKPLALERLKFSTEVSVGGIAVAAGRLALERLKALHLRLGHHLPDIVARNPLALERLKDIVERRILRDTTVIRDLVALERLKGVVFHALRSSRLSDKKGVRAWAIERRLKRSQLEVFCL